MLNDVRLCLEQGLAVGAPFSFAALTREILTAAIGRGLGDADFAAPIESGRHEALANPAFRSNTTTSW